VALRDAQLKGRIHLHVSVVSCLIRSVFPAIGASVCRAALYFARMDYEDYQMRINTSALEFIWQSSPSLGAASRSLTGMLYGGYGPISWDYCFDVSAVVQGQLKELLAVAHGSLNKACVVASGGSDGTATLPLSRAAFHLCAPPPLGCPCCRLHATAFLFRTTPPWRTGT
jgi:hypothetical protein